MLRSEQLPDDDQVMPTSRNIEVAVEWLIFVTAKASVAVPMTTAPGATTRESAVTIDLNLTAMGDLRCFTWNLLRMPCGD
ncbi:hypothetical protein GCM10009535_33420 [Streptomyces thermocarboxydovorans]|uniref:Uncharacterized protein n=1 Tax=Streptomyces thermocarboxydovorans TaxID=59298 RepID=A0ABN1HIJ8_9ACTN